MKEFTKLELEQITKLMEELAGQPKEELGKRQPGEKCMYEIQRKKNYEDNKNTI